MHAYIVFTDAASAQASLSLNMSEVNSLAPIALLIRHLLRFRAAGACSYIDKDNSAKTEQLLHMHSSQVSILSEDILNCTLWLAGGAKAHPGRHGNSGSQ